MATKQRSLFGDDILPAHCLSRRADPATSREAARHHEQVEGARQKAREILAREQGILKPPIITNQHPGLPWWTRLIGAGKTVADWFKENAPNISGYNTPSVMPPVPAM